MRTISCPVCWGGMESAVSGCTKCQTPHHEDCFGFAGGCAVFGCGGRACGPIAVTATTLEISADAPAPEPPRPAHGLPRSSGQRLVDAWLFLQRNAPPALALALFTTLLEVAGSWLMGVTPLSRIPGTGSAASHSMVAFGGGAALVFLGRNVMPFLYSVLVITFLFARARGKELSTGEHLWITLCRLPRCLWASFRVWLIAAGPFVVGCGLFFTSSPIELNVLVGLASLAWLFYMTNEYWLVVPVAAMGRDEEPGCALQRSRELVALARWQIFRGNLRCGFTLMLVVMMTSIFACLAALTLPSFAARSTFEGAGQLAMNYIMLAMPVYQAMLYFECRRAADRSFLKFAPTEVTGSVQS